MSGTGAPPPPSPPQSPESSVSVGKGILWVVCGGVVMALCAWVGAMKPTSHPGYWRGVWGLVAAGLGGGIVMWGIMSELVWGSIGAQRPTSDSRWSAVVAAVERVSFTAALMVGVPEWIGAWLVIKLGARFVIARDSNANWLNPVNARAANYAWQLGILLSIGIAYVGAWIGTHRPPFIG